MDIYKSVKTSTETVMKNPEMLNFVADYLNTKKICDPDQCKKMAEH